MIIYDIKFYAGVVSVLVGVYTLYEKIYKPWRRELTDASNLHKQQHIAIADDLKILKDSVVIIQRDVSKVSHELLTNGGNTTVRDKLTIISDVLHSVKGEVDGGFYMSNIARFISDSTGAWIAVNPALCKLFEYEDKELLGYGWINRITMDDPDTLLRWQQMVKNDVVIYCNYTLHFDDALKKNVKLKAVVNRDTFGNVKSVHGMLQLK